jgi:hypothetical protein
MSSASEEVVVAARAFELPPSRQGLGLAAPQVFGGPLPVAQAGWPPVGRLRVELPAEEPAQKSVERRAVRYLSLQESPSSWNRTKPTLASPPW